MSVWWEGDGRVMGRWMDDCSVMGGWVIGDGQWVDRWLMGNESSVKGG